MVPFGPYQLKNRLGTGGMAEVFLATRCDDPDGKLLVVKRILPHLQDNAEFVQMFLDEARLTSQLRHPNLLWAYDFGKAAGMHYIALEYVEGISLAGAQRQQKDRTLPVAIASWLCAEACAGLDYAHNMTGDDGAPLRIIHRDISPGNILLSSDGAVKLADFGVAKASLQLTRTRPGQLKGKLAYMSPEQASGQPIDHRSDIFSIGLVLYELTTGRRVFPASDKLAILAAHSMRAYAPPDQVVPGYPEPLLQIVNRALEWEPDRRYQHAGELRHALLEVLPPDAQPAVELQALVSGIMGASKADRPGDALTTQTKVETPPKQTRGEE